MTRKPPRAVYIFATKSDLLLGLQELETARNLKYVLAGLFDEPSYETLHSANEIVEFGISPTGESNLDPCYLVMDTDRDLSSREVTQKRGGHKFAIDQLLNPDSIVWCP